MENTVKLYAVVALLSLYGFLSGFSMCRLASVVWTLRGGICIDYGSGLCWGDGYVWLSRDGVWAGVGLWLLGFQKSVKDLVGEDR